MLSYVKKLKNPLSLDPIKAAEKEEVIEAQLSDVHLQGNAATVMEVGLYAKQNVFKHLNFLALLEQHPQHPQQPTTPRTPTGASSEKSDQSEEMEIGKPQMRVGLHLGKIKLSLTHKDRVLSEIMLDESAFSIETDKDKNLRMIGGLNVLRIIDPLPADAVLKEILRIAPSTTTALTQPHQGEGVVQGSSKRMIDLSILAFKEKERRARYGCDLALKLGVNAEVVALFSYSWVSNLLSYFAGIASLLPDKKSDSGPQLARYVPSTHPHPLPSLSRRVSCLPLAHSHLYNSRLNISAGEGTVAIPGLPGSGKMLIASFSHMGLTNALIPSQPEETLGIFYLYLYLHFYYI